MGELPKPTAKRLQRPSWRDSRLIIGIILVLLATTLGAKAISSADDRVAMYVAAETLKPGDHLTADNLKRVDVQLGDQTALYLSAQGALEPDQYALRQIAENELVPKAAIGGQGQITVQPVTILVAATSAGGLKVGSVVDVWVSLRDATTTQEKYLDARLTLEAATVSSVPTDQGRFGAAAATAAIQILVPRVKVQSILAASDKQARFNLVPVPGSKP